jgi:hypothetical protein
MDFCSEMNCTFSANVNSLESLEASFSHSLLRLGAELVHVLPWSELTHSYTPRGRSTAPAALFGDDRRFEISSS